MNLFSLENFVNNALKWSEKNRFEFNMAKFEAIGFDVEKLDKFSVHLYADNTEVTSNIFGERSWYNLLN